MGLFRQIQMIKSQIIDTNKLLELVIEHPIMSVGFKQKLNSLTSELEALPKTSIEPKVQLLFSGNAVIGSQGIKSTFVGKTITPFQEMVKTQASFIRFGSVGKRGQAKKSNETELYLTALPLGSFGIELTQLENNDLFSDLDISNAMKGVIHLIDNSATDDVTFETYIENTPKRNLINLKKFLQEVSEEKSILKMECGELGVEISKEKVNDAFNRVAATINDETEIFVNGIFRGLLLDSGKFEIQNEEGKKVSGYISEDLEENQMIEYDKNFLNKSCVIHLKVLKTKFITGNEKIDYELLEITE